MTTMIVLTTLTAYLMDCFTTDQNLSAAQVLCSEGGLRYRGTGRVAAVAVSCCHRGSERLGAYRASERG